MPAPLTVEGLDESVIDKITERSLVCAMGNQSLEIGKVGSYRESGILLSTCRSFVEGGESEWRRYTKRLVEIAWEHHDV